MKKFEYKVVKKNHNKEAWSELKLLNEYGNEGWEFCTVSITPRLTIYYFKREKQ